MTSPSFVKMLFRKTGTLDDPPDESMWDYLVISSEGPQSGANDETYADAVQFAEEALADMLGFVLPPQPVIVWTVHSTVQSSTWTALTSAHDIGILLHGCKLSASPWVTNKTVTTVPHPHIAELLRAEAAAVVDDDIDDGTEDPT